jgi:hypothetical protein
MKKLDTSPIAPGIAFKPKGGTLAFLQLAYQEALAELTTSRIGSSYDPTKGYILNGCINSGSGSNYVISAGSVFFNGEIYLVPAATFTLTGSNVAEGVITTTQFTADADPSIFTNGVSYNVHNIRQIVFQNGLSGSGAFDFVNAVNLAYKPVGAIGQTIMWQMPGGGSQDSLLATYFTSGTGIHPLTLGWIIDTSMAGYALAGYESGVAPYDHIDATHGADSYTLLATDIPQLNTLPKFASGAGSPATAYQEVSATSAAAPEPVNSGTANPISLIQKTINKLFIKRVS